jgi:1-pyrroline-5-carboxylate dehydrogenase
MYQTPTPVNEPVRSYEPGSAEREALKSAMESMAKQAIEIPCVIGGREVHTPNKITVRMPHDHRHVLASASKAGEGELEMATQAALKAKPAWEAMSWEERSAIFLKAADLIAGPYRSVLNAATMLGQSKNAFQAEIDSACELIDFLRFNVHFYQEILKGQPQSSPGVWNRTEYRPLEGFVLAITPFNFTAIAGNLPSAPALVGNTVVWKPANTQLLAAHVTMQIFREAGLPDGVINLVTPEGPLLSKSVLPMETLAGVHFTGSTGVFQSLWKTVGENIHRYRSYPRLVGETGGKDFIFAHPSADVEALSTAIVRGAFEYQGQKCSACSRLYVPRGMWPKVQERVLADLATIQMGDVRDFRNFVNAVIDEKAFQRISSYLEHARSSASAKIIAGGKAHGGPRSWV